MPFVVFAAKVVLERAVAGAEQAQLVPAASAKCKKVLQCSRERAPVAQLDRVPAFEAVCCRFESDRARQSHQQGTLTSPRVAHRSHRVSRVTAGIAPTG